MTGPARFFYEVLKATKDRDELALTWKVCREVKINFPDFEWDPVVQAFRKRAADLGLEWKGG